jgi:hypothetical protein
MTANGTSIGDSSDDFERMLAVLRFLFSKDLKFVRARLGKTYNSALGRYAGLGRADQKASTSVAAGAYHPC